MIEFSVLWLIYDLLILLCFKCFSKMGLIRKAFKSIFFMPLKLLVIRYSSSSLNKIGLGSAASKEAVKKI